MKTKDLFEKMKKADAFIGIYEIDTKTMTTYQFINEVRHSGTMLKNRFFNYRELTDTLDAFYYVDFAKLVKESDLEKRPEGDYILDIGDGWILRFVL